MKKADPISTEIIRNAFISIAQDMNAVLIRSAYTPVIYEGKDCVVALLDEKGEVLGQSSGLPLFLGNLQVCVQETAKMYGWDYFKEGDIFFVNDAFFTGPHLNDKTIFAPIFWNGNLAGFSASRAHWLDVGGKDPGGSMDSTNIYQEGFRWPVTRLYENNEPRKEIIEFLRINGRFGYSLIGDMNAQIAAGKTGEKRFQGILDRFGIDLINISKKLKIDKEEIINIHLKSIFFIYMIGFIPGHPFMGDIDPKLFLNRLKTPRVKLPSGSVGIVEKFCNIYPYESPGGWNIIGRTPIKLFNNKDKSQPCLLSPGDTVKFNSISKKEFDNFTNG